MLRFKEKSKRIVFPAWRGYEVIIVVTIDIKRSVTSRKIKYEDLEGTVAVHIFKESGGKSYIFLPYNASVDTVVHESWHCIRRILLSKGAELENETVAYHLGYLTQEIYDYSRT